MDTQIKNMHGLYFRIVGEEVADVWEMRNIWMGKILAYLRYKVCMFLERLTKTTKGLLLSISCHVNKN